MKYAFRLVVAALLLSLIIQKVSISGVVSIMSGLGAYTVLATIFYLFGLAVAAKKWHLFIGGMTQSRAFVLTLIAQFYALVLPGQIAGELARGYQTFKDGVNTNTISSSFVLDRLTGLIALVIVAGVGVSMASVSVPGVVVVILVGCLLASIALLYLLQNEKFWSLLIRKSSQSGFATLERFLTRWSVQRVPGMTIAKAIVLGIVFQTIGVVISLCISRSVGLDVSFFDLAWVFGIVSIVSLLPISFGSLGLREGSFIFGLALLGVSSTVAVGISLTYFLIQVLFAISGGVSILMTRNINV